eukprot:3633726-Prymnesium_polylepis.1
MKALELIASRCISLSSDGRHSPRPTRRRRRRRRRRTRVQHEIDEFSMAPPTRQPRRISAMILAACAHRPARC